MPGLTGVANQSPRLTTGALNTQNDATPGAVVSTAQISGSIVQPYGGQVGAKTYFSADDALKVSNVTVGTLYGGMYMYVKFSATTMANIAIGRLVFWDLSTTEDAYQVSQLESANGGFPLLAGVLISVPTAGNYGWIQVRGRATLQCRATVTNASRILQWSQAGAGADNATVDGAANTAAVNESGAAATTVSGGLFNWLAIGESVAANAGLVIAELNPKAFFERF